MNAVTLPPKTPPNFYDNNRAIASYSIVAGDMRPNWDVPPCHLDDIIDLNNNGVVDFRMDGRSGGGIAIETCTSNEPCLVQTYANIKDIAGQQGKHVVTKADIGDPYCRYMSSRWAMSGYDGTTSGNGSPEVVSSQSLEQLKDQLVATMPNAVGANWAFDCDTNKFILYVPK